MLLTKQELNCLNNLACGYSAKEIAKKLELSYRTVENYLQKAKNKLGFSKKSDIIQMILARNRFAEQCNFFLETYKTIQKI